MTSIETAKGAVDSHIVELQKEVEAVTGRPAKIVVFTWNDSECIYSSTKNVSRPAFMRVAMQMFDRWLVTLAKPQIAKPKVVTLKPK